MFGLRKRLWLRLFIAFGFFILLLGSLQWATEVSAQKSSPARQDIILLLDNSRSMGAPYGSFDEPDRRRIRIARLLARYLMLVEPETTSLGVAVFGPQTTPRVPLKPLSQWQERDISAIQPLSCPERSEGDSESRPREDPCNGTRYSRALSWAQDQLQDCLEIHQQHPEKQDCRIIVVTDSKLTLNLSGDSDSPEEIHQAFQSASVSGAETLILFLDVFLDDGPQTEWQRWRDEGLFEYEHKLASMPLDMWLDRILHFLQLPAAEKQMTKLRLEDKPQQVQIGPLPRFLSWLQVDAAPENAPTVTFPDAPIPYQRGYRYRWFRPAFSSLSMQLDGQGFVYYRVISEPAPLQVYPVQIPSEPTEDDPIQFRVWVSVFENVLTAKDRVRVIAHGDVMTRALALTSMPDGSWRGTVPPLPAGSHTLTLSVEVEENGSWQIRARKPISIHIRPLEMLPVLEVSPTVAFTGTPITFKTWLLDEQKYRLVGKSVPVTVHVASPYLKNQGFSIPLSPDRDVPGVWRATTTIEPWLNEDFSLAYPLTLTATLFISGARVATSDAIPLRIWDYPSLDLSHERLQDGSVLVTVTVKGLANPITPTLYLNGNPIPAENPKTWPKSKRSPYVYIWLLKNLAVPPIQDSYLWAKIGLPEDSLGNPTIESPKEYLEPEQGRVSWLQFGLALLGVMILVFVIGGMMGWYALWGRPKKREEKRQKQIDNELARINEGTPESLLNFLSIYSGGDEYARLKLAEKVADELKNKKPDEWRIDQTFWNKYLSSSARNGNELALESLVVGWHEYFLWQETATDRGILTVVEILYREEFYPVWSQYPETAYRPFARRNTKDEWTSILEGVRCIWNQIIMELTGKGYRDEMEEMFGGLNKCVDRIQNDEVKVLYDNLFVAGKEILGISTNHVSPASLLNDEGDKVTLSSNDLKKDKYGTTSSDRVFLVFSTIEKIIEKIKHEFNECQKKQLNLDDEINCINNNIEDIIITKTKSYPLELKFLTLITRLKTEKE